MAQDVGLLLRGLGAAFSNTVPQFRQEMAQEQEAKYVAQQRQQAMQAQNAEMLQARQKAMYQDAEAALKLLSAGDLDGVVALGQDRLQLLSNFPDADPSDTARLTQFAMKARAGDREAYNGLATELLGTVRRGLSMGILTPPETRETVMKPGETLLRDGKPIYTAPAVPQSIVPRSSIAKLRTDLDAGLISQAEFDDQVKKLGAPTTSISVAASVGAPPSGYQNVFDEQGRLIRQEAVPGGPVSAAQQERATQQQRFADIVMEDIGRYKSLIQNQGFMTPTTGIGGAIAQRFPQTPAADAAALEQTIGSNIQFDRLQAMREASPTGGALGSITEQELSDLRATLGSIGRSQSDEQLIFNLDRLERLYTQIMQKAAAYPGQSMAEQAPAAGQVPGQAANQNDPLGIR